MPDWTIRSATPQDIPAVLALWSAAGTSPGVSDTPQALSALLASDGDALLIAEADGGTIGSLIATWDGWRGSFYRLAVHPSVRGRGIATALLREGERRLLARGALRLTAIVEDDQEVAMRFWQAAGYERQAHRVRFVRHPGA